MKRSASANQQPDTQWGHYYVSVESNGQHVLALGPFASHREALDRVSSVRRYVVDHDRRGCWYGYGTARLPIEDQAPAGKLNDIVAGEAGDRELETAR